MSAKKLWYVLTLIAFAIMPLAGCSGGGSSTAQTTKEGVKLTVGGKVDSSKASEKPAGVTAGDTNSVTVYNAQDGSTLGTTATDADGKFSGLTFTVPSTKTILVFKATVTKGVFRTIVPLDLSNPPPAGITASNSVHIEISQQTTDIATAVSSMLGLPGFLGDAGSTLLTSKKTYTDVATQVLNNGGKVLAYNTNGLQLTGTITNASLLPAADTSTFTNDDLNNIVLDSKMISAFIPGKNPIVNFQVTNAANGKGISGLKTFNMHVAKLMPSKDGSSSYWVNYIDSGMAALPGQTAPAKPGADPGTTYNTDGTIKLKGYTVIDHGDGTYTAIYATDVTANTNADGIHNYDASATTRVAVGVTTIAVPGITATGPINPVTGAVNTKFALGNVTGMTYDFTPSTGAMLIDSKGAQLYARDIVTDDACNQCHYKLTSIIGHTGSRPDTRFCVICHTSTNVKGEGEFVTFIHRIHMGEKLNEGGTFALPTVANGQIGGTKGLVTYGDQTYPQDIRNCVMCHKGSDVNNWKTQANRKNCGSCHNGLDFATHQGGQTTDQNCAACHVGGSSYPEVATAHTLPDQTGNNATTPAGYANFTYSVSKIVLNSSKQPVFTFQIKKDGVAISSFATPNLVTNAVTGQKVIDPNFEPISGFAGGPTFYVVYSVPQDGITQPADFNARSSVALANLLIATGSPKQGSITGPDANGYFTATLTGDTVGQTLPATGTKPAAVAVNPIFVPTSASMLTGAMIGNFIQKNIAAYPYTAANVSVSPNTSASGGLPRNTKDVQLVATGFSARRTIVDTAKCNKCHDQLGINPSFHSGARNDATLCAFCHTTNQTSSGWSANASTFVHGIHSAKKRSVPFTWHAVSATDTYAKVTYPGVLRNCEQCHITGGYDFSIAANLAAVPNMLWSTEATGKFDGASATAYTISPYVIKDNLYNYGAGFSYTPATDVTVQAATTTLVTSPITAACSSCHDTKMAKDHMKLMGGSIYEARSTAFAKSETCLTCHGTASNAINSSIPTIKSIHRWW